LHRKLKIKTRYIILTSVAATFNGSMETMPVRELPVTWVVSSSAGRKRHVHEWRTIPRRSLVAGELASDWRLVILKGSTLIAWTLTNWY